MKSSILEILKENFTGLSVPEIKDNLDGTISYEELIKAITELEEEVKIYFTKKKKYILFENSHHKKGIISVNEKGFGFLLLEDQKDIYIDSSNMNGALNKDKVVVEIISKKDSEKPEGRILKVVKRNTNTLVGKVYFKKGIMYVDLDDKKVNMDIRIAKNKTKGAVADHKVVVKLLNDNFSKTNTMHDGEIIKILGHVNDPGVDILSIVTKLNIDYEFDKDTMREAQSVPSKINEEDIKKRKDLRNKKIFTIDGDDAKDIDDGIRVEKLENGNYLLGVYIADVSYYVRENTAIDKEAYLRGTSVYLADRVIPMLPHVLSNGICSLNEKVDRFAMSCEMEIDSKGNVVSYDIFEAIINSKRRMTYKKVNDILENNVIDPTYKEFEKDIILASEIADVLRKNKQARGYIEFDSEEPKIIVDDKGVPVDIQKRDRGKGQRLIEDFMIAANETVGSHLFNLELPSIYRVHGKPKKEKVEEFMGFISHLGYTVTGKKEFNYSTEVRNILDQLREQASDEEFEIITDLLLRTMEKAIYSEENIGHFGLGSKCYSHFTSPIRRYPDLTLHRLLKTYIIDNNMKAASMWGSKLPDIAKHTSETESKAVQCEREVDDMKMAEYMTYHIGEEYTGHISGVTSFGMFVKLPNLIEGLVHVSNMEGDHYICNRESLSLVGERKGKRYRVGNEVKIKVLKASKELAIIDFKLVEW